MAGPCERQLDEAVVRTVPLLRAAVSGVCGAVGVTGYDGGAVVVAGAVVLGATAVPIAQSRFRRTAPAAFLTADVVVSLVVGLSQIWLGAQPDAGWIVVTTAVAAATGYFEWPDLPLAAHAIAVVTFLGYTGGCVLAGGGFPVVAGGSMLVQAALAGIGLLWARRVARLCDRVVHRAAERRVAAAVARAQRDEELTHMALLHDTASTTFLMVSTNPSGDHGWLPGQARRDLELLTNGSPRAATGVDLTTLLTSLGGYLGLDVGLDVEAGLRLPGDQAMAVYHGVREALTNVSRHAGDPSPRLCAREDDGRVVVRLSDRGRGFDPAAVPPHRRGLSRSMHARMAAVGGRTQVRSAPGAGTTVEWTVARSGAP